MKSTLKEGDDEAELHQGRLFKLTVPDYTGPSHKRKEGCVWFEERKIGCSF
jgi:hypothetical protein